MNIEKLEKTLENYREECNKMFNEYNHDAVANCDIATFAKLNYYVLAEILDELKKI